MPTSVISYWKTKLRGKTLSWAGEHESFMYVFNTEELTARACIQQFGEKNVSKTTRGIAMKDPYEEITILHVVYPRENYDPRKKDITLGKEEP